MDKQSQTVIASKQINGASLSTVPSSLGIILILSALMTFASISTDIYLPAMPAIALSLHASDGQSEFTVSSFLIGFSFGQLGWGIVSDKYGRRLPIALGLVLFIIGSAGCALTSTLYGMIAWRVVQAVGACANVVIARAMVRDLYSGHKAASMMSTLITIMAIAPLLGPSIGGQILHFSSWRAIFWALALLGALTLISLRWLPETHSPAKRSRESLARAFIRYGELFNNRKILAYAAAGAFFYGAMYAYIAGTPFAYITYYHVPPRWYGVLFGVGIAGIMASNIVNSRLVARHGSDKLMLHGCIGAAAIGCVLMLDGFTSFGGLLGLVIPLFLFTSCTGFIVANSISGALHALPSRSGSVSAFVGAFQYGTGIIGSGLVALFSNGTPIPLTVVIAALGIACAACAYVAVKSNKVVS